LIFVKFLKIPPCSKIIYASCEPGAGFAFGAKSAKFAGSHLLYFPGTNCAANGFVTAIASQVAVN